MFDFMKFIEVEDIGTVPEQFRPFYADVEGKHTLQLDNPLVKGAVEAITGLNKALSSERGLTKNLKGKAVDLSQLSDYGTTVDEIREGIQNRISELEAQVADPKKGVNVEKIKADLAQMHLAEKNNYTTANENLRSQLDSLMVDQAARIALAPVTDDPDLSLPIIQRQVSVVEEEGVRRVYVVDEQGDRRFNPATALPMTVADLVSEMKATPRFARLFNSEQPRGMPGPGPGSNRPAPRSSAPLLPTGKIAAGLAELTRSTRR